MKKEINKFLYFYRFLATVKTIREYLLKYPENKKLNLRLETVLEEARKQMTEKIINYINIFNKK